MSAKTCHLCRCVLSPKRRKYCAACAAEARRLWKHEQRRVNRGSPYWLDHWLKQTGDVRAAREAYNAYMRAYMHRYRQRKKRDPTTSGGGSSGTRRSLPLAA